MAQTARARRAAYIAQHGTPLTTAQITADGARRLLTRRHRIPRIAYLLHVYERAAEALQLAAVDAND